MVAVCEHTEVCRLRYRVWEVERRRDSLSRQIREIEAEMEERRTPKRLLEEMDADRETFARPESNVRPVHTPRPVRIGTPIRHDGRRDMRWFDLDGGGR